MTGSGSYNQVEHYVPEIPSATVPGTALAWPSRGISNSLVP